MKSLVVCCVCGQFLRQIETPTGGTSHGYCKKHFKEAMQKAHDAFRRDERQKEEKSA